VLGVLAETGFIGFVRANPLERDAFLQAIRLAPTIKPGYHTILSDPDNVERLVEFVSTNRLWDGLPV